MLVSTLLLLPVAVGIHVGEATGVDEPVIVEVTEGLQQAIEKRTGQTTRIDTVRSQCAEQKQCVAEAATRTSADEVVVITLLQAVTRTKLIALRVKKDGTVVTSAEETSAPGAQPWEVLLERVVQTLFAELPKPAPPPMAQPQLVPPDRIDEEPTSANAVLVWSFLGVSVATAVASGVFAWSGDDARQDMSTKETADDEFESFRNRSNDHTTIAVVLGSTALVTGGIGLILALSE